MGLVLGCTCANFDIFFWVQDHHGHAPQEHNPEKEGRIPEIIIGSGQREILSTDRVGSEETEHHDADLGRSGFQDVGNPVTARGLTSLGKGSRQGKIPNKRRNTFSRKKKISRRGSNKET